MTIEEITSLLNTAFGLDLSVKPDAVPATIQVPAGQFKELVAFMHEDDRLYFDMLSSLTAIDNGEEASTIDIIYHLYSIPFDRSMALQVTIPRDNPAISTISDIWRGANWHEREAYDLVGVTFEGHPDLRRILLPNDWEGHPLRKDYKLQDYYHGIKVEY